MKSRKFYWGKVVLVTKEEKLVPDVKALIYGDSGLCLNQYDPTKQMGKFISVSHINTGKRITDGFYTHQSARWFCQAAASLIDWNEIKMESDVGRWPILGKDIKFMRELVTKHNAHWKKAFVTYKLNGGLDDEKSRVKID